MDRRYATKNLWAALLLAGILVTPARTETVTYLHTGLPGSVVLETDQNRNVVARYEYEPYGLPRQAIADQPGYTGHVHDAGSGLVYMQQRFYDPEGQVRAAGGEVTTTPGRSPNHATVSGLTPEAAGEILTPMKNPVPKAERTKWD